MERTSDYFISSVDPHIRLLYGKWLRPVTSQLYRQALQQACETIQHMRIRFWLQDSTLLATREVQDQKWATEVMALLLAQSSLQQFAVVHPDDPYMKASGEAMREKAFRIFGKQLKVEFFDSVQEAKNWLLPHYSNYMLPALPELSASEDGLYMLA
ncbi:hypothetical protein CLV24_11635 [Pontibacter ummariensis]|uniref:SpoIIAA-like n=1 Tax=Pontibacter ummariensis TaxID=1610492 RepID=A0A239I9S2_9BACT|nr:hypothetical protein [Pontibacter ummariensis]PRY09967.1 hypothetical protein CLV24_11635 [Pontibacter ummariensis]SNS90335.1 hypothetical protein SAMN06296052_11664 [Pontibacter ummariensis]